jgi:hypothetical protein
MKKDLPLFIFLMLTTFVVCQAAGTMSDYKGVKPGSTKDDVHQKLGKPTKADGETSDSYDLGNSNSLDVQYDSDNKVRSMVLYFFSNDDKVPKFEDVVGDTKVDKKGDGSQTAKWLDSKAKVSVTMSKTAGDSPMTVITLRLSE